MIKINFQFANNEKPTIAATIQQNIRQRIQDEKLHETTDATVNLEYTGNGTILMEMPISIPINSNTRIIEISFEEIKALISN